MNRIKSSVIKSTQSNRTMHFRSMYTVPSNKSRENTYPPISESWPWRRRPVQTERRAAGSMFLSESQWTAPWSRWRAACSAACLHCHHWKTAGSSCQSLLRRTGLRKRQQWTLPKVEVFSVTVETHHALSFELWTSRISLADIFICRNTKKYENIQKISALK